MLLPVLVALGAIAGSSTSAQAATIVHSNDVLGELEPCGCRNNPMGGLTRKNNLLKRLEPEVLQLDAGDLLFNADTLPEMLAPQSAVQASYLVKALDLMKQDAVVPGEKDFALGLDTFDQIRSKAKVRFLAANLKRKSGKPFLDSHAIFERKDKDGKTIRIAVIGLVGKDLKWPKGLTALPPIPIARKEVEALRKKADFVVALTHQGFELDEALAKAVKGIDIIIGGHTQSFLQTPVKVGQTTIFQSSFRNQYVGVIPLSRPLSTDNYKLYGMDAGYDTPEGQVGELEKLVKEFKTTVADLNMRQEATLMAQSSAEAAASGPKYQTFPRCAECHLKQFDFWRKTKHSNALQVFFDKDKDGLKNRECMQCHTLGLGDPQGISSIAMLAETKRQGDEKNGDPLSLEDLNSWLKTMQTAKTLKDPARIRPTDAETLPLRDTVSRIHRAWTPVQCENCHEPGYNHPFGGTYSKKVGETTCLKCHDEARAPAWYKADHTPNMDLVKEKRALITCPAGELTETE